MQALMSVGVLGRILSRIGHLPEILYIYFFQDGTLEFNCAKIN